MAKNRYLQKLPRKILLHIAQFLYIEDIICLSNTCRRLRRILPLCLIRGPDINEYGPKTWDSWVPGIYFEAPSFSSPVFMITISMYWQDQGWGLQKGKIWIQLIRPRGKNRKPKVVYEDKDIFGVVPHREAFIVKVFTQNDAIIKLAQPGDHFRFMKNIGGGSWRQLKVTKFKLVIGNENSESKRT